jgi:hypothetical protein
VVISARQSSRRFLIILFPIQSWAPALFSRFRFFVLASAKLNKKRGSAKKAKAPSAKEKKREFALFMSCHCSAPSGGHSTPLHPSDGRVSQASRNCLRPFEPIPLSLLRVWPHPPCEPLLHGLHPPARYRGPMEPPGPLHSPASQPAQSAQPPQLALPVSPPQPSKKSTSATALQTLPNLRSLTSLPSCCRPSAPTTANHGTSAAS